MMAWRLCLLASWLPFLACSSSGSSNSAGSGGNSLVGGGAGSAGGNAAVVGGAGTSTSWGGTTAAGANNFAPTFDSLNRCEPKGPTLSEIPNLKTITDNANGLAPLQVYDGTFYYYDSDIGAVMRIRANETKAEKVANGFTYTIIVVGQDLFTIPNDRTLRRGSLATLPTQLTPVLPGVSEKGISTDGTNLYFTVSGETAIKTLPIAKATETDAAGAVTTFIPGVTMTQSRTVDGTFYYLVDGYVWSVPITGGTPKALVGAMASSFDVKGSVVYYTSNSTSPDVKSETIGNSSSRKSLALAPLILPTSTFRQDLSDAVLVGDRVYYRVGDGAVAWVKTDGSDCRIVAQASDALNLSWAMDDSYIYVQQDWTILGIPR